MLLLRIRPGCVVGHVGDVQVINLPLEVLWASCDAASADCVEERDIVVFERDRFSTGSELEHDRHSLLVVLSEEYAVADRAVADPRLDVIVESRRRRLT